MSRAKNGLLIKLGGRFPLCFAAPACEQRWWTAAADCDGLCRLGDCAASAAAVKRAAATGFSLFLQDMTPSKLQVVPCRLFRGRGEPAEAAHGLLANARGSLMHLGRRKSGGVCQEAARYSNISTKLARSTWHYLGGPTRNSRTHCVQSSYRGCTASGETMRVQAGCRGRHVAAAQLRTAERANSCNVLGRTGSASLCPRSSRPPRRAQLAVAAVAEAVRPERTAAARHLMQPGKDKEQVGSNRL